MIMTRRKTNTRSAIPVFLSKTSLQKLETPQKSIWIFPEVIKIIKMEKTTVWWYMETYKREETSETEATLHQNRGWTTEILKALCWRRQNHQNRSKKPEEKLHRKTGRNSRNDTLSLGLYISSLIIKQICLKTSLEKHRLKMETATSWIGKKTKLKDGRNTSVLYTIEKILKKMNNQ